ncbi:MAG: VWA domain-containing protein [Rhizobiaceae bacterium]
MNDLSLNNLAKLSPNSASDTARDCAMDAAMEAYDTQMELVGQEKLNATQGFVGQPRLMSTFNQLWSLILNSILKPVWTLKPATFATATGVIALPFAAVIAWNAMDGQILPGAPTSSAGDYRLRQVEPEVSVAEELTSITVMPDTGLSDTASQIAAAPAQNLANAPLKRHQMLSQPSNQPLGIARSAKRLIARPLIQPGQVPTNAERYERFEDNGVIATSTNPVSTFSIDVDTASYARVRASLNAGNLPTKDMVRVEEMINYFDYAYPLPDNRSQPFHPTVTLTPTPWNKHTKLLQIGIKGYDLSGPSDSAAALETNLVLLLDVSGSMADANKLPLLIKSFKLLLRKLKPSDTVSIVTYAGRSATLLDSVKASDRGAIHDALENLQAGGSTAGEGGIRQAYRLAEKNFVEGGVNRIMLATDGDFNIGVSDPNQLKDLISAKRKSGVYLSVFGFGQGNYNDALMQTLAQNGNGQAAYIDSLAEARKVLVEEIGGTMFTIASDVKIQMEFNPAAVAEYRLIGYETRALKREDFNNDKVDAGEVGAGHTVTALYEVTPVGSPAVLNSPLRYSKNETKTGTSSNLELGFLKLRYKLPGKAKSQLLEQSVLATDQPQTGSQLAADSNFAAAVAAFGQKLRGQPALSDFSFGQIADLAQASRGADYQGYRAEFVQLVRMADALAE